MLAHPHLACSPFPDMQFVSRATHLPIAPACACVIERSGARLFDAILEDADVRTQKARVVMGPALPVLKTDATLDEVAKRLGNGSPAVLVEQPNGYGILTKQDIIGKLR